MSSSARSYAGMTPRPIGGFHLRGLAREISGRFGGTGMRLRRRPLVSLSSWSTVAVALEAGAGEGECLSFACLVVTEAGRGGGVSGVVDVEWSVEFARR